jgi:hypothetical protein
LLRGVDPVVLEVQGAVLEVSEQVPPLARQASLYREPFVARDVARYPAAAIALANLDPLLWMHLCATRDVPDREPAPDDLIGAMANWRGLFSPDGQSYPSLNRTLMNLPRAFPPQLVCRLRRVRLERPVTDPLELRVLLLRAEMPPGPNDGVLRAGSAAEIRRAVARVGRFAGRSLDPESDEDLGFVLRFLGGCWEPHHGRLGGLVGKAIRSHHRESERDRQEAARSQLERAGGPEIPTARPPVSLPAVRGITFLKTTGDLIDEGRRMQHCVASMTYEAVVGALYFFHVEHGGHAATAAVDRDGQLFEVTGPRNTVKNDAVDWADYQLAKWARQLAGAGKPVVLASSEVLDRMELPIMIEETDQPAPVLDLEGIIRGLGDWKTTTALPPIPPPDVVGVTLLRTVGEIADEECWLRNGVGSYANEAVCGDAFVFHVDYDGEDASIVVGRGGAVRFASGPWGRRNAAALKGWRTLRTWAEAFRCRAAVGYDGDGHQLPLMWSR